MTQQLTDMAIDKVALVDRGANGRQFAILKRDGTPAGPDPIRTPAEIAELWKAADAADPQETRRSLLEVVKGFLGLGAADPVAKAQTFAAIVAGRQLTDALYDGWWQLDDALWSAMWAVDANGQDLPIDAKKELVAQNLDEFKAWLLGQMNDATTIAKRDDDTPGQRSLAAFLRKAAGDDADRATALIKAAEPLLAAVGDVGSPDPEVTKRADAQEDTMTGEELAAIQKSIGDAVTAAVAPIAERVGKLETTRADPAQAAPIAKAEDDAPAGPVSNEDILKVLVGIDERLTAVEKGRSSQQSLGGQQGGDVAKRSPLAGILG